LTERPERYGQEPYYHKDRRTQEGQHLRAEERGAELRNTPAVVANPAAQPNVELQSTKQIAVAAIVLEPVSGDSDFIRWMVKKVRKQNWSFDECVGRARSEYCGKGENYRSRYLNS
jgi:hypothetical protein